MEVYPFLGFEEPFNSWSHLIGAFVFFWFTAYLLVYSAIGRKHPIPVAVFGVSCVFLLSMSGVYHLLSIGGAARYVLRILDHAGIYLLIAGSFTAVHGVLFRGFMRWGIILLVWILAINGITLGTIFFDSMPELLSLTFYLSLGWLGILSGAVLWKTKGLHFVKYLILGGVAYTIGALLEFFGRPVLIYGVIGPHELFHVAVLFGISFHWRFIIISFKKIDRQNK